MINENDRIVLTRDLPNEGLADGDVGTVVHVYADGLAFEVEFMSLSGETIAIATVDSGAARAVAPSDITHARVRALA